MKKKSKNWKLNEINYYKCVIKCQYNIKENNLKIYRYSSIYDSFRWIRVLIL